MAYSVIVLKEGYHISDGPGLSRACGSITLLDGPHRVVVDTGSPWDRDCILQGLKKNNLTPEQIEYVVCTHGHSDHVGNLNLFSNAIHIVSHDICVGDQYVSHDFKSGIPYEIDDYVQVVTTPGHTLNDVSVIAKNTNLGTVAVTGDLFECFEDLEDSDLWQYSSELPELQQKSRIAVLRLADYIIPGHGAMFAVPEQYKKHMRVVMFYEESYCLTEGTSTTSISSQYDVIEID